MQITCGSAARLHFAPRASKEIIGPPTEQECVCTLVELLDELPALAVGQGPRSPASFESAAAVLIPRAISLHHPIEGHLRVGYQFHGSSFLSYLRFRDHYITVFALFPHPA